MRKLYEYNLLKLMKFLKMKYLQTHGLIQKKITDININELLEIQHKQLLQRVPKVDV